MGLAGNVSRPNRCATFGWFVVTNRVLDCRATVKHNYWSDAERIVARTGVKSW